MSRPSLFRLFTLWATPALMLHVIAPALAENIAGIGTTSIPASSISHAGDEGVKAHTNIRILASSTNNSAFKAGPKTDPGLPPYNGYFYETPASLACIYKLVSNPVAGCNPNTTTLVVSGGKNVIAIVDAFDYPTAAADLATFSSQFNLPAPKITVAYGAGSKPRVDPTGGWELEAALDLQYAHAMAPNAKIILVEAASDSLSDLLVAVRMASTQVAANGGGEVSMSWGSGEFVDETSYDYTFTTSKVVYVASAGDAPGTSWPSVSPNVISAGGTSTDRNPVTGTFVQQSPWQVTGGGISSYEIRPTYQTMIASVKAIVGNFRGVPDVSFDANPTTGVWVYEAGSWYIIGGTSVAAPALAGIINTAGKFNASSTAELMQLYSGLGSSNFQNVSGGACGPYNGYQAIAGYNLCTGIGTPEGLAGM